ncbi:MAG: M23 family metallopeptidase, partial [bacterium]
PLNLAERAEMAAFSARQENILLTSIPNGFPTESTVITSRYGPRIHPVTKVRHFHNGVDIRAKGHVPVYATADGIVRAADHSRLSGNRVVVRHNFGFESYYAHLHKLQATPGDVVRKGDVIGLSGNSGQSAGPHLHYEIRYLGKPLNPSAFLDWRFGSHEIFTQVEEVKWPSLLSLINQRITHPMFQLSLLDPASKEP